MAVVCGQYCVDCFDTTKKSDRQDTRNPCHYLESLEEWIAWRVIKLGEVLDLEKASNEVSGSSGKVLDLVQKAWAKQKLLKILPNVQTKVQTKVYLRLTKVWTKVLTKFQI